MISESKFLELPRCKKCQNKGKYILRVKTEEQQDEYGVTEGETVQVVCSSCRKHLRRRQEFLKNPQFEDPIRFYELEDYELPDKSQKFNLKKTLDSISLASDIVDDVETELCDRGGFTVIFGTTGTGKSVLTHIMARAAYLQGVMTHRISIPELSVMLSNRIYGKTTRNGDEVVFDLDDFIDIDLLIIEEFDLVNNYFQQADGRRSLVYGIFSGRLKAGKPTIVIMKKRLSDIFPEQQHEGVVPYDFPTVIDKNYRTLNLYGRFKKEKGVAGDI